MSATASQIDLLSRTRQVITLETIMSSAIYLVGYAVIIIGLALGAHYLHISDRWITVGVIVLIGMGLTGFAKSQKRS